MAQQWQKDLPEAQGSVTVKSNVKELWRSKPVRVSNDSEYQIVAVAVWDDRCGNGSNSFYYHEKVVFAHTNSESERIGIEHKALASALALLPAHFRALKKWNGCHPFGPWYYIENTLSHAGDRDYNGLRKGERKQLRAGGKTPVWHLVAIFPDGTEHPIYELNSLSHHGEEKPTTEYRVEWQPWWIYGEGKDRELGLARSSAIWPDATDEELMADDLEDKLKARLPALLVEFRKTIESLGFTW